MLAELNVMLADLQDILLSAVVETIIEPQITLFI